MHYVSHLNHGSDYYSSNYSGIFWPVISVISISGSFSDRFSVSHGVVPPPPLRPRSSGGVFGSVSVPQQQIPSSMPPLAYANYAMGSPQVGFFFFQSSASHRFVSYICLVSVLVSAFYFRCRIGCRIYLWGLNR